MLGTADPVWSGDVRSPRSWPTRWSGACDESPSGSRHRGSFFALAPLGPRKATQPFFLVLGIENRKNVSRTARETRAELLMRLWGGLDHQRRGGGVTYLRRSLENRRQSTPARSVQGTSERS